MLIAVETNILIRIAMRDDEAHYQKAMDLLVGVIVEEWEPGVFEVEFADLDGRSYAFATLTPDDLLPLHHSLSEAA